MIVHRRTWYNEQRDTGVKGPAVLERPGRFLGVGGETVLEGEERGVSCTSGMGQRRICMGESGDASE